MAAETMPHRIALGKFPGAERDVLEPVLLAGRPHQGLFAGVPEHLAAVEFEEVDRLAGVGVRLDPGFRYFEDERRVHFIPAAAHAVGGLEEDVGAFGGRDVPPGLERLGGGLEGLLREVLVPAVDGGEHFRRIARVGGRRLVLGLDPLPADDDGDLPARFAQDARQGGIHGPARVGFVEVQEGFVTELGNHAASLKEA
jgi:hypothetical protein